MDGGIQRRKFLSAGLVTVGASLAASSALGQVVDPRTNRWINVNDGTIRPDAAQVPRRKAKTTRMFKAPPFGNADDARRNNQRATFPNGLALNTDGPGLWIAEQKLSGSIAGLYPGLPEPEDITERAWLVDWNGKVLKTVTTPRAKNTGGIAYGDGYLWRATSFPGEEEGVYQTDMNSRLVGDVRQIPLGPARGGGGSHGAMWVDGKLWIVSNRMHGLLRVDPKTWTPEYFIQAPTDFERFHDCAWDNGTIWHVAGNASRNPSEHTASLIRYDAATGDVIEIVDLLPGSADPHALVVHNGVLISCDAGNHPNWPIYASPDSGWVFRIDII